MHCVTECQARHVRAAIGERLAEVGLELHPGKTKVAYCKDSRRRGFYEVISFTFLGYTFRPREAFDRTRQISFTGFLPGVSAEKLTEMSRKVQAWKLNRRTTLTLAELARAINPVLGGWLAYFTRF
ncbi:MAG TPA: group II intron maturase-specific domain-containing protein, partial [Streptosporangiaceae bacterium]